MATPFTIADPGASGTADLYAGVNTVRSIGAVAGNQEGCLLTSIGDSDIPSYVVSFTVAPTVAMDVFTVSPGNNKVVRLRRIVLVNPGSATGAIVVDLQLGTTTNIGSGGTAPSPVPVDGTGASRASGVTGGPDGAYPGVAHAGDTTQAPGFVAMYAPLVSVSVPAAAAGFTPLTVYDARDERFKSITASGGANCINLRIPAVGAGAANFRGYAEFTVTNA